MKISQEQVDSVLSCQYVSAGCNKLPNCIDWGRNDSICYGFSKSVAVYEHKGRVVSTLHGHSGRVTCVRWLRWGCWLPGDELVSGSGDGTAIIWTLKNGTFHPSAYLKEHLDCVNIGDGHYWKRSQTASEVQTAVIATASPDHTIKIWFREDNGTVNMLDSLSLKNSLCLSLELFRPDGIEGLLMAVGLDDSNIHLLLLTPTLNKLTLLSGHEDWVRSLHFAPLKDGGFLLASGSQDTFIRIWSATRDKMENSEKTAPASSFRMEECKFHSGDYHYKITLDSVICGHEGWIYSVKWTHPTGADELPHLMSASLDRTIVVWKSDPENGDVWLEESRMGEMGGNTLGYLGGCLSPNSNSLLSYSFQGGLYLWHRDRNGGWEPGVVVGGHSAGVVDMCWEAKGRYILSVGIDETTRLHAPWFTSDEEESCCWFELSRPQIHGHAMSCIAPLPNFAFVSGAEEKVLRVFKAPRNVLENLNTLTRLGADLSDMEEVPCGATVPALGLSNKAVFSEGVFPPETPQASGNEECDTHFTPLQLQAPATEDHLMKNTLWPEVMKLYGHGYDLYALATNTSGTLIASACKATNAVYAEILLWDTSTMEVVCRLPGHQLTVTQIAFSPNEEFLLSVSRDRKWCLFQKEGDNKYSLKLNSSKERGVHGRIIWTCGWSHDSMFFATGSRDGRMGVWNLEGNLASPPYESPSSSITALCFGPDFIRPNVYLLAVGLESGAISIFSWAKEAPPACLYDFPLQHSHSMTVKRLSFRPQQEGNCKDEKRTFQLASCSLDHSLKLFKIFLKPLCDTL